MLAAILTRPGTIELQEVALPDPAEGELLVKVEAALTCGTDIKAYLHGHPLIPMPGPFGHEFAGTIIEKGKGVGRFKTGEKIMAVHSAPCLQCPYCRKGLFNLCSTIMASKVLGAFSEYLVLPRHVVSQNVFRKPEGLRFKEAAFLEPLACVVHGMESLRIKKGDTVLIIGAGPIGLLHLLLAKAKGAKVMVTGLEEERLKTAAKLGADLVFSSMQIMRSVAEFTGALGADYVLECTGQQEIWEASVDYVRKGGTVVLFGGCKAGTVARFRADKLHYDEITLRGTFHFTPEDVKKAYMILRNGKVDVKKLISGTYPLSEIQSVFARLVKGEGIKYAIVP